jgi:hypothetical protein
MIAHNRVLNCATAHYLEITLIGLLSVFVYTVVACKYKLRERDEVVNVHIFAEEYYIYKMMDHGSVRLCEHEPTTKFRM